MASITTAATKMAHNPVRDFLSVFFNSLIFGLFAMSKKRGKDTISALNLPSDFLEDAPYLAVPLNQPFLNQLIFCLRGVRNLIPSFF